ncbi:MAG: phosphate ABC transporter substrate-binding protein PstS [Burkholderiaceae bacterium]|jgi:phosphate transport system substrate-binding protein
MKYPLLQLALACAATLSGAANAADLTGAGSSFVAPVTAKWADAYNKSTGTQINYQSIGSSAGLKQIEAKTVDFGASDAPLKPEDLDAKGLVQFPVIVGGIVPVFNLPGIATGTLHLTGPVLADIYLGKITKWDDPAIVALNSGVKLPDTAIAVVRRADGSGTSFNFTNYLAKVSPEWKSKVGEGTTVNWPVGTGGKGNEGVSLFVQRLPGAIGYVEYAYAKQSKMPYALVQNAAGAYVQPDEASFQAAAAGAEWEKNRYYIVITNQPGKDAWPIAASTFVLMQKVQDKPAQGVEVLKFFDWALNKGQKLATDLDYVPLPANLVQSIEQSWTRDIKDTSGKAISLK